VDLQYDISTLLKQAHQQVYLQKQSSFFTLPTEIRCRIYSLALEAPSRRNGAVELVPADSVPWKGGPSVLSILRVCHLINDEASGLFCAINHFQLRCQDLESATVYSGRMSCFTVQLANIERLTVVEDSVEKLPRTCLLFPADVKCSGYSTCTLWLISISATGLRMAFKNSTPRTS